MAKWNIDPDHSVGSFSIRHMTVAFVHGQMNRVSGTINLDPEDITSLDLEFKVDPDSIITGIGKRDDHLKSEEFFDIEKQPDITFKGTALERTGFNTCKVRGDLTVHGIKKTITLEADVLGPVKSPFGETTLGITGRTVLNREDFGMKWNEPMEKGGFMVGKDVEVSVNLEADLVE
ncbi:MAG: YceI family protein [Nitrospirota bacterium]